MIVATYATLDRARVEISESDPDVTADNFKVMQALRDVTRRIDEEVKPAYTPFLPIIETRYFDAVPVEGGGPVDGETLLLNAPLIALTTLANGDGTVITSDLYELLPRGGPPYGRIVLTGAAWCAKPNGVTSDAIALTGSWCYHPDYANAHMAVDALTASVSASATALLVTSADGLDLFGRSPRFSVGQLLRCEGEWMPLTGIIPGATPGDPDTLTVLRGARGSTAATHASGKAVEVFEVHEPVAHAAARWASSLYRRQGIFATSQYDTTTGVATRYPKDMPDDVYGDLKRYMQRTRILPV